MLKRLQSAIPALGMYLLIGAIAAILTGCGPSTRHYTNQDDPTEALVSFGAFTQDDETWNCPSNDNVLPTNSFDYSFNGHFSVCYHRTDASKFVVSGSSSASTLCAYPLKASGNSLTVLESPKCFSVANGSVVLDFGSNEVNYMVIVSSSYTNQMNQCLSSSATCPAYSKGFVK